MSTLSQAIEEKRGLPYAQALAELQEETVDVIETIEGKDLRDIVTVLCSGLDYRLQQAPDSPLKAALVRAFNSLSIVDFGFNLNDPLVVQMLDAGVEAGYIDVNERMWFYGIATKQKPKYPELTLRDIVSHFEPEKTDVGDWVSVVPSGNKIALELTEDLPEPSLVRIEMSESLDGVQWTKYQRVQHFYGVHKAGIYFAIIPNNGLQRKLRVRGEHYRILGTVKAV
jgi:hypothetical protein